MDFDRRMVLAGLTAAGTFAPLNSQASASPQALGGLGADVTKLGVAANASHDQSRALQDAINAAAGARIPLVFPPGVYRAGDLMLPAGAHLVGVPGASRIVLGYGASLFASSRADQITLTGLVFDGASKPLPERRGLITIRQARDFTMRDCAMIGVSGTALVLENVSGEISNSTFTGPTKAAIFSLDATGLVIRNNVIRSAGNNGIMIWRSEKGDDGTIVSGNRIEDIYARDGGSGQNGNGISLFRAGNVIVSDNRIRNCTFSAVRGNAASNMQVRGNTVSSLGEVAIYSEFDFEGSVIANNVVDGAALGVSITNFKEGGRLAVCQGNLIRNLVVRGKPFVDQEARGIGIAVEADTVVSGNVVEKAPVAGIWLGWKEWLRDVAVTGNLVRNSRIGIAVQVSKGAGAALIADNMISGTSHGAIVGMDGLLRVSEDLQRENPSRYAQLTLNGNRVQ
ncbi:MAG: TIGR03808 family TAT-translocated repetitive protein [Xanthobacteraceae bacterium]|nr:TIGR03808 family TAT-translocated repetitive protein [Xanthobacteraceae bacterium]QYK45763.1 MAG: TIGR03808 family TAT-translocated repetitive protein [Xanthobacteraceae bacterium]